MIRQESWRPWVLSRRSSPKRDLSARRSPHSLELRGEARQTPEALRF